MGFTQVLGLLKKEYGNRLDKEVSDEEGKYKKENKKKRKDKKKDKSKKVDREKKPKKKVPIIQVGMKSLKKYLNLTTASAFLSRQRRFTPVLKGLCRFPLLICKWAMQEY